MSLYAKLAFSGIRKNKQIYIPFFITSVGMAAVYYIISSLGQSLIRRNMYGGRTAVILLELGSYVIAAFSLLFLFYTYSFLTRRRQREFGLYNILGMGKRHIAVIMAIETAITYAVSLILGIAFGALFAKLFEGLMLDIMGLKVGYEIRFSWYSAASAALVFGIIFALILAFTLFRIGRTDPIELLKSEQRGEKPPRANPVIGVVGVLLLAGAYYIALTVEQPLEAVFLFFIAVLMVIAATYMLFVSGSVLMCAILKRRKNYYYRESRFVSISSMAFRMKRNGAGLASICILLTMVLVTITSTLSLYKNVENMIDSTHPREVNMSFYLNPLAITTDGYAERLKNGAIAAASDAGCDPRDIISYKYLWINTEMADGKYEETFMYADMKMQYEFTFVQLSDYNESFGCDYTLSPGEALVYDVDNGDLVYDGTGDVIDIDTIGSFKIVGEVDDFEPFGLLSGTSHPSVVLIIDDISGIVDSYNHHLPTMYVGFNTAPGMETEFNLSRYSYSDYIDWEETAADGDLYIYGINWQNKTADTDDYMSLYGGLLFLGIMLSGVFTVAAVLIIYYKQITEGYEDRARFGIMQKVGLSEKQIKKSVNAQMRAVFIMPIAAAAMHTVFAMPILQKILKQLEFNNDALLLAVALSSVAVCALIYAAIYKLTANSYYKIVKN